MLLGRLPRFIFLIPRGVWGLGFTSFLLNISSMIIFSITPIYLTSVLGITTLTLGVYEGLIEFIAQTMRISSGIISDYFKCRKKLLLISCSLSTLARSLFAFSQSGNLIITSRVLDRISNGIQATPREALIGDLSPKNLKGTCYGARQAMAVAGSLLGAFIVWIFLEPTSFQFSFFPWIVSVPPLLAMVALTIFVKDSKVITRSQEKKPNRRYWSYLSSCLQKLTPDFWRVVLIGFTFMLSNYSGVFMILRAKSVGFNDHETSIVLILQSFFSVLSSFPVGRLSDQFDRRYFIGIGFVLTIIANVFFACAQSRFHVLVGASLWGLQVGMTQNLLLAQVSEVTVPEIRGTGFGIYHFLGGIALLTGNYVTGYLDHHYSKTRAFMTSALITFLALLMLPILKSSKTRNSNKKKNNGR